MLLVDELLDVFPLSHPSYEGLYDLFAKTCDNMYRKMSNWTKAGFMDCSASYSDLCSN